MEKRGSVHLFLFLPLRKIFFFIFTSHFLSPIIRSMRTHFFLSFGLLFCVCVLAFALAYHYNCLTCTTFNVFFFSSPCQQAFIPLCALVSLNEERQKMVALNLSTRIKSIQWTKYRVVFYSTERTNQTKYHLNIICSCRALYVVSKSWNYLKYWSVPSMLRW